MIESLKEFGKKLRAMGLRGESAYGCVDGVNVHDIPAHACNGRSGVHGKTFSGYLDEPNLVIHVDCAEDPEFHLTIDLSKVTSWAAQPGGPLYAEARESFTGNGDGE
tara:strand:+ start:5911 stop:6231 length:321 start_codon:yes stop_codon:yes gene_type:complete